MKILIIDPGLTGDESGHAYGYDKRVMEAARARGIVVHLYGATSACSNEIVPAFTPVTAQTVESRVNLLKILKIFRAMIRLYRQLRSQWYAVDGLQPAQGDLIFIPTILLPDLLPLACFIWQTRHELAAKKIRVVIMLRFDWRRGSYPSAFMTQMFGWGQRFCHGLMSKALGRRLRYISDTQKLSADYTGLLRWPVAVCPIPIIPSVGAQSFTMEAKPLDPLVIVFLGGARINKGFDCFVELIEELSNDASLFERVRVIAQAYLIPSQQPPAEYERSLAYFHRLKRLADRFPQIQIQDAVLPENAYHELLRRANIAVLLYRPPIFRAQSSNILIESVLYGVLPIVARDTWLDNELQREGLGDLGVNLKDPAHAQLILRHVLQDYTRLQDRLQPIRRQWMSRHTANAVLDCILRDPENAEQGYALTRK